MSIDAELYPWLSAGAIAWGLADCFFGYRIFRITITLWGIVVGCVFGQAAGVALGMGIWGVIGGVVAGGLLGGGLAFMLYLAAVFVAGFAFGVTVGMLLLANFNQNVALLTGCVLGVIGGILAVKLQRVVLILATAVLGSFRALLALLFFTQRLNWVHYLCERPQELPGVIQANAWLLPAVLVLAGVGAMAQFGLGGERAPKAKKSPKKE